MIWLALFFSAMAYGCHRLGLAIVQVEQFTERLFEERERQRQIAAAKEELEDFKAWQKLEAEWQEITDHFVEIRKGQSE